jgi:hypothetical protein
MTFSAYSHHAIQTQIADRTFATLTSAFVSLATILQIFALLATPVTRQQLLIMSAILTAVLARTGKLVSKELTRHVNRLHAQTEEVNATT